MQIKYSLASHTLLKLLIDICPYISPDLPIIHIFFKLLIVQKTRKDSFTAITVGNWYTEKNLNAT